MASLQFMQRAQSSALAADEMTAWMICAKVKNSSIVGSIGVIV